jgi:hypothetical protein
MPYHIFLHLIYFSHHTIFNIYMSMISILTAVADFKLGGLQSVLSRVLCSPVDNVCTCCSTEIENISCVEHDEFSAKRYLTNTLHRVTLQ